MKKYTYVTYSVGFKVSEKYMETDHLVFKIQNEEDKKALERIRKRINQLFNNSFTSSSEDHP